MSNKVKRKITVNLTQKSKTQAKNRPSVFERLGIKAGSTTHKEYCRHWAQNGSCPYGKGCKYSATHTLISPSKQRAAKIQTEPKKHHAKEGHNRLHGTEQNWDQWDPDELEDADPDDLERKRQELQRELELQMKMEHKARKKEKKVRKDSSPSSDSSSTSSDTTSSSDDSSSSSSSSLDAKRKKNKKPKTKRASSSSSEDRKKHKKVKHASKSATREKPRKIKYHTTKVIVKSPSPVRMKKKSETPPIKPKIIAKKDIIEAKASPRPLSRSSDRKEKHRTPSPKTTREKEREKEREREKEKEREREKEREKEREREREREREKEKEKERERERERERVKQREKEREREKKKDSRSPRRDNKISKDIKRRDSPDSSNSRDRKISPGRSKLAAGNSRRDQRSPDRRDKRDERARSRGKDRSINDKSRKDKHDSRDKDRDRDRDRDRRRDDRDAAREKEREEALARCQERQRERERLKELEKKENDRRARDRGRREDRGLDKPSGDRVERLLPLPEDRIPPGRRHSPERDRDRRDGRGHSVDTRKSGRNSPDRHDRLDREMHDRNYDRDRAYDREHDERNRDYGGLAGRMRDDRRLDEKDYETPYDRTRMEDRRYLDIDDHYDGVRDDRLPLEGRDYVDDRRGARRDMWDMRDDRVDMDRSRGYGRGDGRAAGPGVMKGRDWVDPEYGEHEWDSRGRRPLDWENRDGWDNLDRPHPSEEEWRHYNRGMENWPPDDRRRWPNREWRERDNSRPRSAASHNVDSNTNEDSNLESRRKEIAPQRPEATPAEHASEQKPSAAQVTDSEKESSGASKRPSEDSADGATEAKRPCLKVEPAPVLDDDLSEISDDADDILNRDEEIAEETVEEPRESDQTDGNLGATGGDSAQSSNTPQKASSPRSPTKSVPKDESIDGDNMDLDFEEISEDELDEESRIKGIGDALGVDWASLVAESRSRLKLTSSAKLRWESHNVLVNLGVSVQLAGEDLVKEILKEHAEAELNQQNEEKLKQTPKLKSDSSEYNVNGIKDEPQVKEEIKKEYLEPKVDIEDYNISHPIAAIQVATQEKQQIRRTLFSNVGPHRRALSARRDLVIRRHLCNLPINDAYVEAPKRHDPELFKIATQLFERCL